MTVENTDLLILGKIVKPHGLKGGAVVYPYGLETLLEITTVTLLSPEIPKRQEHVTIVNRGSLPNGNLLIFFEGLSWRDQIEQFRGWEVAVSKGDVVPCEEDEVFLADLMGAAITIEGGAVIGTVTGLYDSPAPYPTLIYTSASDGSEQYLPLPPENFIDFLSEEKIIVVAWSISEPTL